MLTDAKITAATPKSAPCGLGDSNHIYLHVSTAGGRHWRMNYTYGRSEKYPSKPAQKTLAVSAIVEAAMLSLLGVGKIADRPNENNGDTLPAAGSGGAYLSGGVLKFA